MSSLRLLLLFVVWVTMAVGEPLRGARTRREISPSTFNPLGTGKALLAEATIGHVLVNAPRGARLISAQPPIPSIEKRLPDNYTLIRDNVVDTFRCDDRVYGYYADVDNDCQIFHVCLPLQQLFPANFTISIVQQFTFICPEKTIFSQDALVCVWEEEALECAYAPDLYWINQNFFRKIPKEDGSGYKYSEVNSPLQ